MWNLQQNTCTVTRVWIAPTSTAVIHTLEHVDGVSYNLVRFSSLKVSPKSDTAGIVFKLG
jgi:hypothetical protein